MLYAPSGDAHVKGVIDFLRQEEQGGVPNVCVCVCVCVRVCNTRCLLSVLDVAWTGNWLIPNGRPVGYSAIHGFATEEELVCYSTSSLSLSLFLSLFSLSRPMPG